MNLPSITTDAALAELARRNALNMAIADLFTAIAAHSSAVAAAAELTITRADAGAIRHVKCVLHQMTASLQEYIRPRPTPRRKMES